MKRTSAKKMFYVGVDLGGTHVRAGLVDASGRIHRLAVSSSHAYEGRDRVLEAIRDVIRKVMDKRVAGIGIGVPGHVHVKEGKIMALHNIPAFRGIPLKKILEKTFRKPVRANNDAKCFALAEARFGHGKGAKRVAGLILGTGCGCGVVIDGRLFDGRDNLAGELGMIHYRATLLEDYVTGRFITHRAEELKLPDTAPEAVARYARGKHPLTKAETVRLGQRDLLRPQDVQKRAKKIFDELGYHVGYLVSLIICAYNPDIIILGGGVSKSHALFWQSMKQSLDLNVEYGATANTPIAISTLDDAGVRGAASLFQEN